jgi:undecaprenyl-diphosphatase
MPSDHAVLFAALAASFWMINRWAGLVMALHALIVVGFARVYLGYHWPGDILAGAVVGVAVAALAMAPIRGIVARTSALPLGERHPELMYPILFLVLFQMTSMFETARQIMAAMVSIVIS